ncbi:MAG: efflux RND transporter permease subunit [Planctomycetota bacterium]
MTLSEVCIRRPVFTWVLVAVPVVLGIVAYNELGVDLFPKVDFPVVAVTTILPSASVEEMETSVAKPIEEAINTVSGVEELHATVREGVATVIAQFVLEKNGDVAAQEVRDKLSAIQRQLPEGTETPVVDKFDIDAAPILTIAVSGKRDVREVTEIVDKQIKEQLQTVPNVGAVFISGGEVGRSTSCEYRPPVGPWSIDRGCSPGDHCPEHGDSWGIVEQGHGIDPTAKCVATSQAFNGSSTRKRLSDPDPARHRPGRRLHRRLRGA